MLTRFDEIARWLTDDARACGEDAVLWLNQLQRDLRIPGLSHWGIAEPDFPSIIEKAAVASSMKGNPLRLEDRELRQILVNSR